MSDKAICVGINDYPGNGNDLSGCVNDADDWSDLLDKTYGFGTTLIKDRKATSSRILDALDDMIATAKAGDSIAFTYSGHGTWVYDRGEQDESDNRDEAICAYDRNIIDDELRKIIRQVKDGVVLTVISDSCHSGGITRQMLARAAARESARSPDRAAKPRYLPPESKRSEYCTDPHSSKGHVSGVWNAGGLADRMQCDGVLV